MSDSVYRYEVPIDDQWHKISSTKPLHVGCRKDDAVKFWARALGGYYYLEYRVYGTGHLIEDSNAIYIGTTYAAATTAIVWHLLSRSVKE